MAKKLADEEQRLYWMQMDWPRYIGETPTFNNRHHGACLMLMSSVWLAKGALHAPTEEDLAQAARCSESEWAYVRERVMARFVYEGGTLSQPLMDVAYQHAQEVSAKRRAAGAAGGLAKAARAAAAAGKTPPAEPPAAPAATDDELAIARANAVANGQQNPRHKQSQLSTNVDNPPKPPTGGGEGDAGPGEGDPPESRDPPPPPVPALVRGTGSAWNGQVKHIYSPEFEAAWADYPGRDGSNNKNDAYRQWNARLKGGKVRGGIEHPPATAEQMHQGVLRYAAWAVAAKKVGTTYVMAAERFFGPSRHFDDPHHLPASAPSANGATRRAVADDAYDQIGGNDHAERDSSVIDVPARFVRN